MSMNQKRLLLGVCLLLLLIGGAALAEGDHDDPKSEAPTGAYVPPEQPPFEDNPGWWFEDSKRF